MSDSQKLEQDVSFIASDLKNLHTAATLSFDEVWDWLKTNETLKERSTDFADALVFCLGERHVRITRLVQIGEALEIKSGERRRSEQPQGEPN